MTDKGLKLGFEIFFNYEFIEYDYPFFPTHKSVVPRDWVATLDGLVISALMKKRENKKEKPTNKMVEEDQGSELVNTEEPEPE